MRLVLVFDPPEKEEEFDIDDEAFFMRLPIQLKQDSSSQNSTSDETQDEFGDGGVSDALSGLKVIMKPLNAV
jgi:hypothetical protein